MIRFIILLKLYLRKNTSRWKGSIKKQLWYIIFDNMIMIPSTIT